MWRVTARLRASSEAGTSYVLVQMHNGAEQDFVLEDGRAVTRLGPKTFKIDETAQVLTVSDGPIDSLIWNR